MLAERKKMVRDTARICRKHLHLSVPTSKRPKIMINNIDNIPEVKIVNRQRLRGERRKADDEGSRGGMRKLGNTERKKTNWSSKRGRFP